jgi:hypothetical protein
VVVPQITDIKIDIQTPQPGVLVVTATGKVPRTGYTKPTLSKVAYITPPDDGYQDYHLMAIPPEVGGDVISPVTAKHEWKNFTAEAPWLKGVRVHGVGKGVMEKPLP